MQLRMIARRAREGALTILGDVAQATGPVAYASGPRCCRISRTATTPRSRSSATPTACRGRSWSSRCRCSTRSRRASAPPLAYRTGAAEPPDRAPRRRRSTCSPRRSTRRGRLAAEDGLVALIVPDELVGRRSPHGRRLRQHPAAHPARGERARVRPRRRRRAGARRRSRARPAGALRRADPTDDDAGGRPCAPAPARACQFTLSRAEPASPIEFSLPSE